MKNLNLIKESINRHKPFLHRKYKVGRVGIFGSYVRGTQKQNSDLDILIDYEETPDLISLIELEFYLEEVLDLKIDLVTIKGLKPRLKENILNEVIFV